MKLPKHNYQHNLVLAIPVFTRKQGKQKSKTMQKHPRITVAREKQIKRMTRLYFTAEFGSASKAKAFLNRKR